MASTSSSAQAVMLALGGYEDRFNVVNELANAASMSFVQVSGGSTTVAAGDFVLVLDGSAITLPASPTSGNQVIVLAASPAGPTAVSPNGSGTINGVAGGVEVGEEAVLFKYNGTTWQTE